MSEISAIARKAILAGKLPRRLPARVSAWQGMGACCAVCDSHVQHHEIEFELEFGPGEDDPRAGSYRVHSGCYEAWEAELRSGEVPPSAPVASEPSRLAAQSAARGGDSGAMAVSHARDLSAATQDVTITGGEWGPKYRGGEP
jgi:hypothetical protein